MSDYTYECAATRPSNDVAQQSHNKAQNYKLTDGAGDGMNISRLITLRTIIPLCLRNGFFHSGAL
jgi:hypothetical protein